MLAVSRDDENLECVKTLLQHGANFETRDSLGNSVIHLAAMNGNNKILDYLTKNLKTDMFSRNKKGESALSLANGDGAKILEQYQKEYDQSRLTAQDLLDELTKEEEHDEEAKLKRKQKKWRNKVNKIAKTENITVEEVEKRLEAQDRQRKEQEEQARLDEIEKEKKEAQAEIQRKEELKRQREELIRQAE
jgi:ankyrin repeat protein